MLSDHNVMELVGLFLKFGWTITNDQLFFPELVGLFLKFGWTITNDQLFFPALIDQSQIQNKYTILV